MNKSNFDDNVEQYFSHLFLPYHLSLALRKLNFDIPCLYYYDGDTELLSMNRDGILHWTNHNESSVSTHCSAPMLQQVIDWLRDVHHIEISLPVEKKKDKGMYYGGYIKHSDWEFGKSYGSNFDAYYTAYHKGIEYALELLNEAR